MKKICLVLSVAVAAFMFFAATNAGAECDPTLPPGGCFENNEYNVSIVPDSNGSFPIIHSNGTDIQSEFRYKITGAKLPNYVDTLIPICTSADLTILGVYPSGTLYGPPAYPVGYGDPNTGFGLGLTTYNTFVWNSDSSGIVSVTFDGKVYASPNAMAMNRGTANYAYGQILSPACSATSQVSAPSVPLSAGKEMNFGGIDICLASTDQSGCPTLIYSCCNTSLDSNGQCTGGYSSSPCSCPTANRQVYTEENFTGINQGHLKQIWTLSDSRCPITLMSLQSIPCSQPITAGGITRTYTYYTTPPCTK